MRFDIDVEGHEGVIEITLSENRFAAQIVKSAYGQGAIFSGRRDGDNLSGAITLKGHTVDFRATIAGDRIAGEIWFGIFWDKKFTGILTAEPIAS